MSGVNYNDTDNKVIPRDQLVDAAFKRVFSDGNKTQSVGLIYDKAELWASIPKKTDGILEPDLATQQIDILSLLDSIVDNYVISLNVCATAANNRTVFLRLIHNDNGVEYVIDETSFRRGRSSDIGDSKIQGTIGVNSSVNQSVYLEVRASSSNTSVIWRSGSLNIRRT